MNQLGILLHPPEVINEKFLIKLRDCVLRLSETHPLKKWMKWISSTKPLNKKDQDQSSFLVETINSQFNLITDLKMKGEIINLLLEMPEDTLPEQLLKSFLYLIIGNITRSDNILSQIINTSPRVNWEKTGLRGSIYHKIGRDNISQIFKKIGKHPADRKMFQLMVIYLQSYYNDKNLLSLTDDYDTDEVESKMSLSFLELKAPHLIHFVRLSNMRENRRIQDMRTDKYPLEEQSYWFWPFFEIDPLIYDSMVPELKRIEANDLLWFIYLIENEKIADVYSKKSGKTFLPGRRPFLKEAMNDHRSFMMSLYKLIELGDLNKDVINRTTDHLLRD